jgi:putative transposase
MEIIRGYKIELVPNKEQLCLFYKSVGVSRFAYNWCLDKITREYEANKALATMYDLKKVPNTFGSSINWNKEWVILKKTLPWTKEVSKSCGSIALRNLEKSFKRFFNKTSNYPKYKSKKDKETTTLDCNVFIMPTHIQLPKIGLVRLKQKNRPIHSGKFKLSSVTISKQANKWFASFCVSEGQTPTLPNINTINNNEVLGVDLGIKELAITSDGQVFENPKAYKKNLKKLKKYQRRMDRKVKGSNNRQKAKLKLAKVHKRVVDIRNDNIHKMTTSLVKTKPKMIVVENLKVKNMVKNHKLAGSISDSSFGKIKELLKYKCEWEGIHLVMAPTFYASSKYCSNCGAKHKELKLSDREWTCDNCGIKHDRDINAAKNLQYLGLWMIDKPLDVNPTTVGSAESYACGDERLQFLIEQCSSMKQEIIDNSNNKESCVN